MFLTGMLNLAKQFRMPVDMLELGASAGLNQYFDEFRYTTQNWKWGNPTSPVQVSTEWQASLPPLATPLTVLQRKACDQNPLSLSDRSRQGERHPGAGGASRLPESRRRLGYTICHRAGGSGTVSGG